MNRNYDDIIYRMDAPPIWWQEGGVPRYCLFDPEHCTGIYANEAVLAEVACQFCETNFVVLIENGATDRRLAAEIRDEVLHYGDPPNVGCCSSGPHSGSAVCRVLEYWAKSDPKFVRDGRITSEQYFIWTRDRRLEKTFKLDWVGWEEVPLGNRWAPQDTAPPERISVWGVGEVRYGLFQRIFNWIKRL